MKRKIISIFIVSCFLLTSLLSVTALGVRLNVSDNESPALAITGNKEGNLEDGNNNPGITPFGSIWDGWINSEAVRVNQNDLKVYFNYTIIGFGKHNIRLKSNNIITGERAEITELEFEENTFIFFFKKGSFPYTFTNSETVTVWCSLFIDDIFYDTKVIEFR